jgi:transposase
VEQWLATHPWVTLLFLPTYCPGASPIERVLGDVHDTCTRNYRRKRLPELLADKALKKNPPREIYSRCEPSPL